VQRYGQYYQARRPGGHRAKEKPLVRFHFAHVLSCSVQH
jgi:hypothetical protein